MSYKLFCWRCRAKIEAEVYTSIFICDNCLSAPMRERAAEDSRLAAYLDELRGRKANND